MGDKSHVERTVGTCHTHLPRVKSTAGEKTWGDMSHVERTVGNCHTHLQRVKSTAGERTWGDISHFERTVGTCPHTPAESEEYSWGEDCG